MSTGVACSGTPRLASRRSIGRAPSRGELAGQLRHFVHASTATEDGLDLHGEAAGPGQQYMVDIAVSEGDAADHSKHPGRFRR